MDRSSSSALRWGLLISAGVLLLIGFYLYVFAESVATLPAATRGGNAWPWPAGPLMIRFVAAAALGLGLGFILVAQRPDDPTLEALGLTVGISSGLLLLHSLINLSNLNWSKPLAYIWVAVVALAFAGATLLVWRVRSHPAASGSAASASLPPTPRFASLVAAVIAVLTLLVGGTMFFLPELGRERWPWDLVSLVNVQLLGAIFMSVGILSAITWRRKSWYGFDVFFATAGAFALVALIASFMHWELFAAKPITSWIFVALYVLGAFLGFYPYFRYGPHLESGGAEPAKAK